ncbi:MAG: Zn-ribbon domain-containing protein [Methanolinea sp.]|nr:Zn-ribbon domain-containing protein [Methanolinea sp.]
MPHKCVRCGKEYRTTECEILKGCRECGGKKFIFIPHLEHEPAREAAVTPVPEERKTPGEGEQKEKEADVPLLPGERLESIRIISPGTYELNIEKLATSDERVVGLGKGEGSYLVDLLSMVRPKKRKGKK